MKNSDITALEDDRYISTNNLYKIRDAAEEDRQGLVDCIDEAETGMERDDALAELKVWDAENGESFTKLQKVCENLPEDETMIRDDKIKDYLEEWVNDCYDLPNDLPSFIILTIDFDALKQDYTTVTYGDWTYWVRYL